MEVDGARDLSSQQFVIYFVRNQREKSGGFQHKAKCMLMETVNYPDSISPDCRYMPDFTLSHRICH